MLVNLYAFSKRKNSTARPSSSGLEYYGILREDCDTLSPSIGFDLGQDSNLAGCNYAYIQIFNRYYFIDSWTWADGLWYANMSVDPLATWRTEIGSSLNYVLRSSVEFDGGIIDTMYPAKPDFDMSYTGINTTWSSGSSPSGGTYIVGIINDSSSAIGATAYYAFTPSEFRNFMHGMLSTTSWAGVTFDGNTGLSADGLTEATYKSLFNPFQYIVSCMWVPLNVVTGTAVSTIPFGWWYINSIATMLTGFNLTHIGTVSIPTHPQQARGDYLNYAPYTRLSLRLAPFGLYPLNPSCYPSHSLYYTMSFDLITGKALLTTKDANSAAVNNDLFISEQIGVPIQIAQITQEIITAGANAGGGILGAITSAITGNIGGAVQTLASGIAGAIDSVAPQVVASGPNGSWAGYIFTSWLQADFLKIVGEDNQTMGRPLCQTRTLSSIPGYQLIANAEVSMHGTPAEMDAVKNYLETGYFYE